MRVIHVLRKPLAGSVTANLEAHGCGGLNVGASRIGTEARTYHGSGASHVKLANHDTGDTGIGTLDGSTSHLTFTATGRWPANLILEHLAGCREVGVKQVRSDGHFPASRPPGSDVSGPRGHQGQSELHERHMDGETVPDWSCYTGCPVHALDIDSGVLKSGTLRPEVQRGAFGSHGIYGHAEGSGVGHGYDASEGGASRFFKQVGGNRG